MVPFKKVMEDIKKTFEDIYLDIDIHQFVLPHNEIPRPLPHYIVVPFQSLRKLLKSGGSEPKSRGAKTRFRPEFVCY